MCTPCFENTRERGHPARLSGRNSIPAAGRMPALPSISWFLGARHTTGMRDCFAFEVATEWRVTVHLGAG